MERAKMKWITAAVAASVLVLAGGVALAQAAPGSTANGVPSATALRNFQKETLALRDELAAKQANLEDEYGKPNPDSARVAALEKDIVGLETRIHAAADKNGLRRPAPGGWGGGMMYGWNGGRGMRSGVYGGPGHCGCW